MYRNLFLVLALAMGVSVVACQPDDSSDNAARHLEQAGEEVKDAGEAMAKKAEEAGDQMANEIEDACEAIKEGAGAADTDC